jgi:aconitase A
VALVEAYAKQQGLWHEPDLPLTYSERIELDLSSVVASLAGPRPPQDRVPLTSARAAFRAELSGPAERAARPASWVDEASREPFPASDAPGIAAMTCIGASGPLIEEVAAAVRDHDLTVVSVLSGNRNSRAASTPT